MIPCRAVLPGEVGQGPHRVADGRDVRLRQWNDLIVGVDRLRLFTRSDHDRGERADEAAGTEETVDDRQHLRPRRDLLVELPVDEQVVDPVRREPLEAVAPGRDRERWTRAVRGRRAARRTTPSGSRLRRSCTRPAVSVRRAGRGRRAPWTPRLRGPQLCQADGVTTPHGQPLPDFSIPHRRRSIGWSRRPAGRSSRYRRRPTPTHRSRATRTRSPSRETSSFPEVLVFGLTPVAAHGLSVSSPIACGQHRDPGGSRGRRSARQRPPLHLRSHGSGGVGPVGDDGDGMASWPAIRDGATALARPERIPTVRGGVRRPSELRPARDRSDGVTTR